MLVQAKNLFAPPDKPTTYAEHKLTENPVRTALSAAIFNSREHHPLCTGQTTNYQHYATLCITPSSAEESLLLRHYLSPIVSHMDTWHQSHRFSPAKAQCLSFRSLSKFPPVSFVSPQPSIPSIPTDNTLLEDLKTFPTRFYAESGEANCRQATGVVCALGSAGCQGTPSGYIRDRSDRWLCRFSRKLPESGRSI
ncbi:predicted protein [Histoplasma capsulatum H143]|uniref:Uncharacterized protein n=1 Tax=Ajellomyces capsulatus (strain H143) TaxID=544712 RepID=C6HAI8_AJECH|nr:predicted protein [Histoplasma capsulatum H143]